MIKVDEKNEYCTFVEVIANSAEGGVSRKRIAFDELYSLYKVEYSLCQFDKQEALRRANKRLDEHHYDSLHNNSHHFVTWCKTGQEHPLTDILKSLEYIEGKQALI